MYMQTMFLVSLFKRLLKSDRVWHHFWYFPLNIMQNSFLDPLLKLVLIQIQKRDCSISI